MKKALLKSLTVMIMLTLLVSAAICPAMAAAENTSPKTLLALGDSLTTGYGLDNYTYGGDPYLCDSYINQIAAAYGLESGTSYINRAVNGDKSGDLARLLPSIESEVKAAEMIIITIGGNDLLGMLPEIAQMLSGRQVSDFAQAAMIFAGTSAEEYEALKNHPVFAVTMKKALEDLTKNLQVIAGFIKEKSPDARVIFLKQYNPTQDVPGFEAFGTFGGGFLDTINATLETVAASFGYETVDVPSVINHRAAELTNIQSFDIHPNTEGHSEIAKVVAEHLGLSLDLPENTEAPTEAPTEPITEVPTDPATDTPAESLTEAPTDPATEAITDAPIGKPADTHAPTEETGCAASASLISVLILSVCAAFVIKRSH